MAGAGAPCRRRTGTADGTVTGTSGHGGEPDIQLTDRAHAPTAQLSDEGRALHDRLAAAVDDDLDTATALAVVRETVRAPIADDERRWLALDADFVLGLDLDRVWDTAAARENGNVPAAILAILGERSAARAARDFARADELRRDLSERGWDVVDGPDGSTVRPAG